MHRMTYATYIYIYNNYTDKSTIQLASVGLAQAHPNMILNMGTQTIDWQV